MELKKNKVDYIIVGIVILFILIFVALYWINADSNGSDVNVYYNNKLVYTMNTSKDEIITLPKTKYSDLLADVVIEVNDGKVRIKDEESPYHYCSTLGYQSGKGSSLICAPNHVRVTIMSSEDSGYDYVPGGAK